MKSNRIIIDKTNQKEEYKVLLRVKDDNDEYIIYTKNEKNDCDEILAYAGKYLIKDGCQVILPIEDENILELLDNILLQVQS